MSRKRCSRAVVVSHKNLWLSRRFLRDEYSQMSIELFRQMHSPLFGGTVRKLVIEKRDWEQFD